MTDLHYWSITETAQKLRSREISVSELTQAHIDRIDAINPRINAITTKIDQAMETARALDRAGPPVDAGPLWGIPVTTKINVDQTGYPNSNGVAAWGNNIAIGDSPIVSHLKSAGAVIIGRTNTPEFSIRWFTSNPLHGVSKNPWDETRTPGGSSGAAAASVASGIGYIAHGNDLGGSLRYPAYCCGVATIRPSLGKVAAMNPTQSAAGIERGPLTQMMSVQGPIARSIADVRIGLGVMSQRDRRDPHWVDAAPKPRHGEKITVGIAMNPFSGKLHPAVENAIIRARNAAIAAGLNVVDITPPHADDCARVWGTLLFTESEAILRGAIETYGAPEMQDYYNRFVTQFELADVAGLMIALQKRIMYQRAWAEMFETVDAIIMPTSLQPAFLNDLDFNDHSAMHDIISSQAPLLAINLLGLPSAAIPTHVENGLPLGVQMVGAMHDDFHILNIAEKLERELGFFRPSME